MSTYYKIFNNQVLNIVKIIYNWILNNVFLYHTISTLTINLIYLDVNNVTFNITTVMIIML